MTACANAAPTLAAEPGGLPAALNAAFALDDRIMAEDVITGRGIDLAVLGRPGGTA